MEAVAVSVEEFARRLLQRYRRTFGPWAPPLSSLSESVFEAIHMWAAAARRARTTEPGPVADAMRAGRYELPRGTVVLQESGRTRQPLHLVAARGATFGSTSPGEDHVNASRRIDMIGGCS